MLGTRDHDTRDHHSLPLYLDIETYVSSNPDLTTLCHPHCLETITISEYIRRHLSQSVREYYFFDFAASEKCIPHTCVLAVFTEHLSPLQKFYPLYTLTHRIIPALYFLQRCRNHYALQFASRENIFLGYASVDNFFCSKYFQTFVQFNTAQLTTVLKRFEADHLNT